MKIGVVSDTHSGELPRQMFTDFKEVDFIIHAGDFCSIRDYKILSELKKEVKGVHGNMDDSQICELFPRRQIIQCDGVAIGLFHGEGPPKTLLDVVKEEFKNDKVDVIIFGHSHHSLNERQGNVLFFNPGSPNDAIFAPYCSYGILEIKDKKAQGKIIKVK